MMECCGVCPMVSTSVKGVLVLCKCELCACGHCRHKHEKWRWHQLCSVCTPREYAGEYPSEIDSRELGEEGPPYPDLGTELDKHRPVGDPRLTCCAESSARIRKRNEGAA